MTEEIHTILKIFKNHLKDTVKVLDVRAFGSRARGDNDPDSDLDVLVVVEKSNRQTKEFVRHVAWEVGFEYGLLISTIILSYHDLHNSPLQESSIIHNIELEGISV